MTPRPSSRLPVLRAAAAAVLAVTLLSSGIGTAARWSDDAPLELQAISTGVLDLRLDPARIVLEHTDLAPDAVGTVRTQTVPVDVTHLPSLPGLAPGDTVAVTTRAHLDVEGTNLAASLVVDPGVPAGSPLTTAVRAAPELGAPVAPNTWSVTPAHGGAYDVTVTYRVPLDVPGPQAGGTLGTPRPTVTLAQI
ncbi:hypothetical protein [Kocuria rosea]|uniref:hypothetical protein n=1 Tax=Kocuria rosea TaxID=1275 RepID=UPI00203BAC38|nr:hypothetical protein [Kocuria rosea]MCM3688079.1 hypothetical protein [Kocuria rosea]